MIKVIKHGQTEFTHTCSRCGCEFTYEYEDIKQDSFNLTASSARFVICPDCGNQCYINIGNIGWPWPNSSPIPCNTPSDTALNPCSDCDWWKRMTTDGINWYVGDTPCTWCAKNPMKVTCDTTTTATISINDNSSTIGTLQLTPEDLKKYNMNIYGYRPTSGEECPPPPPKSGSNVVKSGCNSCHKETKRGGNKNCNCTE